MGRNLSKIIKSLFVIVCLICFECFAGVVADNDGSAFITKAEFEALKDSFNAQISSYNESIDSKVDGAIASYLAGIKTSNKVEIESTLNKINAITSYSGGWFPMCKTYAFKSTNKPVNGQVAFQLLLAIGIGTSWSGNRSNQFYSLNLHSTDSGVIRDTLVYVDKPSTRTDGKYYCIEKSTDKAYFTYQGDYLSVSYKEALAGVNFGFAPAAGLADNTLPTWTYGTLKNETTSWAPMQVNPTVAYSVSWHPESKTSVSYTIPAYWVPSYELTSTNEIWPIMGSCPTTSDVVCLDLDKFSVSTTSTNMFSTDLGYKGAIHGWHDATMMSFGANNSKYSTGLNWYYNYHPLDELAISNIGVKEVSNVMSGKKSEFYCGLPICSISDDGILTMKLKFHSKSGNKIYYAIRSTTFGNDSTYTNESQLNLRKKDDTPLTTQEANNDSTLEIKCDVKKDTTLWIKAYDVSDPTKYVGVESISLVEENY